MITEFLAEIYLHTGYENGYVVDWEWIRINYNGWMRSDIIHLLDSSEWRFQQLVQHDYFQNLPVETPVIAKIKLELDDEYSIDYHNAWVQEII